jgi:excisionase family DNA binding protein
MVGVPNPAGPSNEGRAMSQTIPYPQFLTVEEVAKALRVVPLTVRRLIKSGKLKASHVGRRVRIRPADLDKYLDANPA